VQCRPPHHRAGLQPRRRRGSDERPHDINITSSSTLDAR